MFAKKVLFAIVFGALSVYLYIVVERVLYYVPPLPSLEGPWWGPGEPFVNEDTTIRSFRINVSDPVLEDLNRRLADAIPFEPPLQGIQQQYGINTNHLKNVIDFWRTNYNWREREKILNKFPQFTVSVQGLKIHYVHVKPTETKGLKVLPLLMLHGWPSSVKEFFEVIPILTTPQKGRDFVFEVIAPSVPGFAFSEATVRPGLDPKEIAVVFKNLMHRLGFERYYLQGGDWGGQIVQVIATLFPEKVIGVHSNFCYINTLLSNLKIFLGGFFPSLVISKEHVDKVYPLSKKYMTLLEETGYMHIQATKPDTLGVALRDSPVGLAAYMLEKYPLWTNFEWKYLEDGGLTKKFKLEDLLDNVMIYWVTRSITTSMRLYAECFTKQHLSLNLGSIPTTVPSGCARFSHELVYQPESILRDKFVNLIHVTDHEGGHFAAAEEPQVFASDLYLFVEKVEQQISDVN